MLPDFDLEYLSRKCRILAFCAAVAVVAIHSDCTMVMNNPVAWDVFVQKLYCQRLVKWAVPFFFMLSGLWFARGAYMKGQSGYGDLLGKKAKSLVVPWLIFALLGVLVCTPLVVINNYMTHRAIWGRTVFNTHGIWDALNETFAITIPQPRQAGFLWYVRTLFVLFVFAPIWRLALKVSPWIFLLGFICLKIAPYSDIPCIYFGAAHPFFLGIFLGAYSDSFFARKKIPLLGVLIFLFAGVMLAVMWAGADAGYWTISYWEYTLTPILLGAGIWGLYDHVESRIPNHLPVFVWWSMWLYLIHSLVAGWFLAAMRFLLGKSDYMMVWLPFVNILFTTTVTILFGYWIKRRWPKLFAVCCGGRG